jgi:hypothetical protein
MDKYVLLLHETPALQDLSPEEIQAIVARYKAWGQKLRAAGRHVDGQKLEDGTARIVRGEGAQTRITDGPYTETKDVVAGFYIILAESFDEAAEWSKDCPHLAFGAIEIRKIDVV